MNNALIKKLTEAYGPSGFEDRVRALIRPEVEPYVDEVHVDALGNLIALKKGGQNGLKVMIVAHMDEIGVMATHITEKGFLRFTNIGFLYPHTLMGNRVQFADGTVGIVYSERLEARDKLKPIENHYIDVGASSREDCPVHVGDAASFMRPFIAQNGFLSAKSMDDRIGCAIAIESLQRLQETPHEVYFVFSVQEEVGTRGAQVTANAIEPEVGLALDVTSSGDTPESRPIAVELGKGPGIKVKDSGMIAHGGLVQLMKQRAQEADIPYQLEVLEGGSTDARSVQIAGPGCAVGSIAIPCRYVHTQSETVHAADVESAVKLLREILSNPIEL